MNLYDISDEQLSEDDAAGPRVCPVCYGTACGVSVCFEADLMQEAL